MNELKMNELKIFNNNEFGEIRVLESNNETWFVGKDVASILGYKDTSDAMKRHVDSEDKLSRGITDSGQNRQMYVINESGLYSLILSSKLPNSKKFKRKEVSNMKDLIALSNEYKNEEFKIEVSKELKKAIANMPEETLAELIKSISANVKIKKYEITLSFDFYSNQMPLK